MKQSLSAAEWRERCARRIRELDRQISESEAETIAQDVYDFERTRAMLPEDAADFVAEQMSRTEPPRFERRSKERSDDRAAHALDPALPEDRAEERLLRFPGGRTGGGAHMLAPESTLSGGLVVDRKDCACRRPRRGRPVARGDGEIDRRPAGGDIVLPAPPTGAWAAVT